MVVTREPEVLIKEAAPALVEVTPQRRARVLWRGAR
jgi:hypothetical protein